MFARLAEHSQNKLLAIQVFVEKVLRRLFPSVPCGQEKRVLVAPASGNPAERVATTDLRGRSAPTLTGGDSKVPPRRRLYTASLPPEGYVPAPPEPQASPASEDSSGSDDAGKGCPLSDQDFHDQPKRRRARKHKSKKNFKDPNNIHGEQEELEKQQSLLQEKLQPQCTDGPTISRNKKRKLKKKQQIKRKKAAGVITKASGVNFLYQPEQSDSERDVEHQSDGEDGADARGGDGADAREGDGADAREGDGADAHEGDGADARGHCSTDTSEENHKDSNEEGVKSISEKAAGILNFLKSTQEIYFYDGICQDPGSAVLLETTQELFKHLDSHGLSPSDVLLLDHMKSLLLLQDTKGLRRALEMFPERCTLPAAAAASGTWAGESPPLGTVSRCGDEDGMKT
ncbi:glutamate-rich protein 1 isoform X2 [Panthera leo]|uniref:glutamate-rich protein 1 isoform X2 n=1 Tax=Panthera leo TaxID=9689 RepID=UPI001C6A00C4|nr:glutamate-rich protein 1 isoform X2 [Panthera leo]